MKRQNFCKVAVTLGIIALVVGSVFLTTLSCQKGSEVYKIGAILPLTGGLSFVGEEAKRGIEIAENAVNARGGIKGKKVEFVFGDSKNSPKEGVSIFNKMVNVERLPVIISAMSSVSNSCLPIASEKKVVLAVTIVSASDFARRSEWVLRYFLSSEQESKTMADFVLDTLKSQAVAVLHVNDDYGLDAMKVFRKHFTSKGGKLAFVDAFDKTGTDFRSQVVKAIASKPNSVYLIGYGNNLGILAKQLRETGFEGDILSFSSFAAQNVIDQAAEASEGVYLTSTTFEPTNPASEKVKTFVDTFRKRYNRSPTHYAAFSHDLAIIICKAMKEADRYSAEAIRISLMRLHTFEGLFGVAQLNEEGDYKFNVVLKQIKGGKVLSLTE